MYAACVLIFLEDAPASPLLLRSKGRVDMRYRDSNRASKILMQWRKIWTSSSVIGCLCGHYKRRRGHCRRGYHRINRFCVGVNKCVMTEAWFNFVFFTKTSEVAKEISSALELSSPPKARNISYLQRSTTEASSIDRSYIRCIFQRPNTREISREC